MWALWIIPATWVLARALVPGLFRKLVVRLMRHAAASAVPFVALPRRAPATASVATAGLERLANRRRARLWVLLVGTLLAVTLLHLSFVEPNPDPARPNLTLGAVALDFVLIAPFLIFAALLPPHAVSWWLTLSVPSVFLGMGLVVTLQSIGELSASLLVVHVLLVAALAWLATVVVLLGLELFTRLSDQSSGTVGISIGALFGFGFFTWYVWNATSSVNSLALLMAVPVVNLGASWLSPRANVRLTSLLYLRAFAREGRSRRLLTEISGLWSAVGPICLIQGPDAAQSTLSLTQLRRLLTGRLKQQFVSSLADFDGVFAAARRPHRDGRYSVVPLYCFDNTWQGVAQKLAEQCDFVVMDLCGFTHENAGCSFELQMLERIRGLAGVAILFDERTEIPAVNRLLRSSRLEAVLVRSTGSVRTDARHLLASLQSRTMAVAA